MHQLAQAPTTVARQGREEKGSSVGPVLLALSAWFFSAPTAVFGLLTCLRWMIAQSHAHLAIPKVLEYPSYILLWIASAFAAIAMFSRRLGEVAALLNLIALCLPRTPLVVRIITVIVLALCFAGIWGIQSQSPSATFPF